MILWLVSVRGLFNRWYQLEVSEESVSKCSCSFDSLSDGQV